MSTQIKKNLPGFFGRHTDPQRPLMLCVVILFHSTSRLGKIRQETRALFCTWTFTLLSLCRDPGPACVFASWAPFLGVPSGRLGFGRLFHGPALRSGTFGLQPEFLFLPREPRAQRSRDPRCRLHASLLLGLASPLAPAPIVRVRRRPLLPRPLTRLPATDPAPRLALRLRQPQRPRPLQPLDADLFPLLSDPPLPPILDPLLLLQDFPPPFFPSLFTRDSMIPAPGLYKHLWFRCNGKGLGLHLRIKAFWFLLDVM